MIETLAVILGYRCNFSCAHCCVSGNKDTSLSGPEKDLIVSSVKSHRIKNILFIGGEPTLYIPDMRDFVSRLEGLGVSYRMTTNGHFAVSKSAAKEVLSNIHGLSAVNLSCDTQHERFLPEDNMRNLYSACLEMGIAFRVILALSSPLDLVLLKKIKRIGDIQVLPQKMLPLGSAKKSDVNYKHPSFDSGVFQKGCPNKGTVVYMCGKGFTICCAGPAISSTSGRIVHPTIEAHLSSDFYGLVSQNTLGEMVSRLGLSDMEMLPEYSSPCTLCESLLEAKYGGGL